MASFIPLVPDQQRRYIYPLRGVMQVILLLILALLVYLDLVI